MSTEKTKPTVHVAYYDRHAGLYREGIDPSLGTKTEAIKVRAIGFPRRYYRCIDCQLVHWEGEAEFTQHILKQDKEGISVGVR